MSNENSMYIDQRELASEYGRYVETKSKKGPIRFIVKTLVIPLIALSAIVALATFIVANNSPATYTQVKDIFFANVDLEKITGLPETTAREYLDGWLILNPEQQQAGITVQEETLKEGTAHNGQIERSLD